jgi:RES domain-containing protein
MFLWRISLHPNLAGMGAELGNGRWHTAAAGKRLVYLSEHPAVALVETLVNLRGDPKFFPEEFQLLKIEAPEAVKVEELSPAELAGFDPEDLEGTQEIGDEWLVERSSALLRVPSVPSPESWNYLLNPLHPDAGELKVEWARRIAYDKRLFRLGR